jgi:hypothetical protein
MIFAKRESADKKSGQAKVIMGNISPHFSWVEFSAPAVSIPPCYRDNVRRLCSLLEILREKAGNKPITIHSGYRTPMQNKACGGATRSQHLIANAVDITIMGIEPEEVAKLAKGLFSGIGHYATFTHLDNRAAPAEWWD